MDLLNELMKEKTEKTIKPKIIKKLFSVKEIKTITDNKELVPLLKTDSRYSCGWDLSDSDEAIVRIIIEEGNIEV